MFVRIKGTKEYIVNMDHIVYIISNGTEDGCNITLSDGNIIYCSEGYKAMSELLEKLK